MASVVAVIWPVAVISHLPRGWTCWLLPLQHRGQALAVASVRSPAVRLSDLSAPGHEESAGPKHAWSSVGVCTTAPRPSCSPRASRRVARDGSATEAAGPPEHRLLLSRPPRVALSSVVGCRCAVDQHRLDRCRQQDVDCGGVRGPAATPQIFIVMFTVLVLTTVIDPLIRGALFGSRRRPRFPVAALRSNGSASSRRS